MRKKVLNIIADLNVAGAQTVVMSYLRNMAKIENCDFYLAVLGKNKGTDYDIECQEKGYSVIYCNYEPFKAIPYLRSLINWIKLQICIYRLIKKIKPNILHSHQTGIMPYVTLPFFFSGITKKFHTLHSDPYAIRKSFAIWAWIAFHICNIYPICVTEDQGKKAQKKYGLKKYIVIPNGLDLSRYRNNVSKEEIRQKLCIPPDAYVVGCVCRLDVIKNLDLWLKIFSELKKERSQSIAVLVGEGVQREHLKDLCKSLGIEKSVIFTGHRKDVEFLYHAFDVFMLTSFSESSSIVSVEAQLSGIKCVLSTGVPSSVIISDNVNRISIEAPIQEWVDAIMGKIECERIKTPSSYFSLDNSILKLSELYNS